MAQTYSDKPTLSAWNALAGGAKIAYGTYNGTGKYGNNNRNSLTFDFEPKLVIIVGGYIHALDAPAANPERAVLIFLRPVSEFDIAGNSYSIGVTWTYNGVSWYSVNSAAAQHNEAGTHYYLAIG